MMLLAVGCNFRNTPIELRERLAFRPDTLRAALDELSARYGCEAVIISTCNRVELYLARTEMVVSGGMVSGDPAAARSPLTTDRSPIMPDTSLIEEFLREFHHLQDVDLKPHLYHYAGPQAVRHLFHVVASLDSMIVGEGQIAGQVKQASEIAEERGTLGPLLRPLFQHARVVAKRVRSETGIARGHVSVSSVAVDYVRQVFDHFRDKTVLVIGAGKMGELTLRHLKELKPQRIVVTNRSPEKACEVAAGCGGQAVPWEQLDDALAGADIVLSTTGAPEPIMTRRRFNGVLARRTGGTMVILDIAVPRDFDPRIHDGDRACLFNIDDLKRIRAETLKERHKHVNEAEAIIAHEQRRFVTRWAQRQHVPTIARLTQEFEAHRRTIFADLMRKLNGKLSDADRAYIDGALRLLQNRFLHGPLSALAEEPAEGSRHTLLEALRKLFRLEE